MKFKGRKNDHAVNWVREVLHLKIKQKNLKCSSIVFFHLNQKYQQLNKGHKNKKEHVVTSKILFAQKNIQCCAKNKFILFLNFGLKK